MQSRACFRALPAETQVWSVVQEHKSPGCAETTFGLPLRLPDTESSRCVRGAECPAEMRWEFPKERRDAEEPIALSSAAESLFVSFCLLPPLILKLELQMA